MSTPQPLTQPAPLGAGSSRGRRLTLGALAVVLLGLLLYQFGPGLLWAYHIQRAGALLERGLEWPTPRNIDSLPTMRDDAALTAALDQLTAAQRRHPTDDYAPRLVGQVYLARGDWQRAAEAFEQARALAPSNPLPAWEAGLAYEQLQRMIDRSPRASVLDQLAQGTVDAPPQLIRSLFCSDRGAISCYSGRASYTQSFADDPAAGPVTLPVLFLHPPARIVQTLDVPTDTAALQFALGLDPVARDWQTDGATFRVWVTPQSGAPTVVYEQTISRDAAREGWMRGWADLSRWAGRRVTLVLESAPGPQGSAADDWYGWGDPTLTTVEAARAAQATPLVRLRRAWTDARITPAQLRARADEAKDQQDIAAADVWYRRAAELKRGD